MKLDIVINNMAHAFGKSRKEVIQMIKGMSNNADVKNMLKNNKRK